MADKADIVVIASLGESLVTFRGELLLQLRQRKQRVLALAPEMSPKVRDWLSRHGIAYGEAPLDRTGTTLWSDLRFLRWVVASLRRAQPSIVLAYTAKPVVYGMLAAKITKARRYALISGLGYAFIEGQGDRRNVRRVLEWLYRAALRNVDGVFFQNPDDEAFFRQHRLLRPSVRSVVLAGSGVDVVRFQSTPIASGPTVFLLIARLLGDKGVREYVEAARLVKSRRADVVFRLAGWIDTNPDAIGEHELDAWVADRAVEFLGRLDDVRPALAACTVYVLPSYREGTPRTVLEAMAMGRPIITTDAPGCRETVVDGSNGLLVPPRSVHALAQAMERLAGDRALVEAMGARSRARAEHTYDAREVSRAMLDHMCIEAAS